jgi:hypothetical protein
MNNRSRNSEAAQRFAERRQRENAAPRLHEAVPGLATLRLEVDERRGMANAGDPKHVRLVVVDSAPALFEIPCGDKSCKEGGHDLTDAVMRSLQSHQTKFELEDTCHGNVGKAFCGTLMHVTITATYK